MKSDKRNASKEDKELYKKFTQEAKKRKGIKSVKVKKSG